MDVTEQMHQILDILACNARNNPRPNFIETRVIANQLGLSIQETKQLLRFMHVQGTVESSVDCDYSLITVQGMNFHNGKNWQMAQVHSLENPNDHYSSLSF